MLMKNISFAAYGRLQHEARGIPPKTTGVNTIWYLHSGSANCKYGSKEKTFVPGHLYFMPQNIDVSVWTDSMDHTFFTFFSTPTVIMKDILDIKLEDYPVLNSAFSTLKLLVDDHLMSITQRDTHYDLVKSYLNNMLFLLNDEFDIPTITDDAVNNALEYLHTHYFLKISIDELANRYHLEEGTFIRRFKRYTNTTPYKYLKTLRVNVAMSLIEENTYTLSEIAEMVGYSDAATLSHSITTCFSKNPNNSYRYINNKEKLRDYEEQAKYGTVRIKDF